LQLQAAGKGQSLQNLGGIIRRACTSLSRRRNGPGHAGHAPFNIKVVGRGDGPEARLTVLPAVHPSPRRRNSRSKCNQRYLHRPVVVGRLVLAIRDNSVLALSQAQIVGDGRSGNGGFRA